MKPALADLVAGARGSRAVSRTQRDFGRAFRAWLRKDERYHLLDRHIPGGDWTAGACWPLAAALAAWIGPSADLVAVQDRDERIQHVLVQVGSLYFDGDGARDLYEVLDYWNNDEPGVEGPVEILPFGDASARRARRASIRCPSAFVRELRSGLDARFGPASAWGFEERHGP